MAHRWLVARIIMHEMSVRGGKRGVGEGIGGEEEDRRRRRSHEKGPMPFPFEVRVNMNTRLSSYGDTCYV